MSIWIIARIVWLDMWRRKDAYLLLVLMLVLLVALTTLNVFGLEGASAHTVEIGLLLAWLFGWGLSVMAACRLLPEEEAHGTIFSLLAKPVRRFDVILGKWLGAWLASGVAVGLCLLLVAGIALGMGLALSAPTLAQSWLLFAGAQAIVVALGLLFSTRMHRDAAAALTLLLSASAFLLLPQIPVWLVRETGWRHDVMLVLYHILPHFEMFDLRLRVAHGYGPAPWSAFGLALGYAAAQTTLALSLAHVSYARRLFARDRMTE